jgi:hypothetical protein
MLPPSAEEALKVLKDLEDQQVAHSPTLSYTEPARMVMDDIFKTIKSFCGPSYKLTFCCCISLSYRAVLCAVVVDMAVT